MSLSTMVVHAFPANHRIRLIKLIREWSGMSLVNAKGLTDGVPFQFVLETPPANQGIEVLRQQLNEIGATCEEGKASFEVSEEDMVKAMVAADDGQTGFERCRYMLRAALGTDVNGVKLVRIRESGAGIYYSANG